MYTQKRRAEKQLFAWLNTGKKQPAREKASRIKKKELLTLTPGDSAEGRNEGDDDNDGWEPGCSDHKSMWQRFGVLRIKCQKVGLNMWASALYCRGGGGLVLTQHLITW